jgi:hypothetical protein
VTTRFISSAEIPWFESSNPPVGGGGCEGLFKVRKSGEVRVSSSVPQSEVRKKLATEGLFYDEIVFRLGARSLVLQVWVMIDVWGLG